MTNTKRYLRICENCAHWGKRWGMRDDDRWRLCDRPPFNGYANADHSCGHFEKRVGVDAKRIEVAA
jgi:hypothetical protein